MDYGWICLALALCQLLEFKLALLGHSGSFPFGNRGRTNTYGSGHFALSAKKLNQVVVGHKANFRHTYSRKVKNFLGAPTLQEGKIAGMIKYSPEKIVALRKERGWNQSELARRAGMSSPSLWALENGRTKMPKFETVKSVAAALGVPMQAIMADEESPDLDSRISAAVAALHPANKNAMLAAAEALLKSQKQKPK